MLRSADLKPDSAEVGAALHKALAAVLCTHGSEACATCMRTVAPLVKPIARALVVTAIYKRTKRADAHIAIGQGIEKLFTEAKKDV